MANFDYSFNISGNFISLMNGMSSATGEFSASAKVAESQTKKFASALATFSYAKDVAQNIADGVNQLSSAGIALDTQMHDLSAVAGVTGEGLKQIEGLARQSAKAFGTDASVAVEGYKLLLSQLSPELGKYPDALSAMGDCIQTTSKLMGGDGVAAAEVLTTAMNQYGVSMEVPMAASKEMARMMNVMAAAGQNGSAELPAISAALQQCGMAAKAANVSFEETNAAIQVLDKAGKKASEGGVALRNVMGTLAKGRFLPKDVQEELKAAGIDINVLTDNSRNLHDRLETLKPVLNDAALLSKLFDSANASAARALIQGTDSLQDFTEAVTGTNSATEQAAIVMDSYAERQARINQQIEDFKITIFQATGDLSLWCGTLTTALVPLAQLAPMLSLVGKGLFSVIRLPWLSWIRKGYIRLGVFNAFLSTSNNAIIAWMGKLGIGVLALLRFGTVGIFNAVKGVGALILSMITGGSVSAGFAATASAAFKTVTVAFYSVPLIGWITLLVTVIGAAIAYFWNTSAKFRAVLKGTWAAFKTCFTAIGDLAKQTFGAISDLVVAAFKLDGAGIDAALKKLKAGFSDYGKQIGQAFNEAYNAEMSESAKKESGKNAKAKNAGTNVIGNPEQGVTIPEVNPLGNTLSAAGGTGGSGSGSDSGSKIKNITIHIEKLVERFEIHSASVGESTEQVKSVILETLMGALNDTQLATA